MIPGRFLTSALVCLLLTVSAMAQQRLEILRTQDRIQVDGFLDDWSTVPPLVLSPTSPGVHSKGAFGADDLAVTVRALWDGDNLYLAVNWKDNTWDVQQVTRREAIWITPENRRRDRMYFFDNLGIQIQEADYNYILWISPRLSDRGPFVWQRLLLGLKGMERATALPMVTGRFRKNMATLEIVLSLKDLKINPRAKRQTPLTLLIADSDLPGGMLETKLSQLKWLEWSGRMTFAQKTHAR